MKNLRKHILRSLMGVAGLLTFTACYGPYIPPEELQVPAPDQETKAGAVQENQDAEPEAEIDVTAEL